MSNLASKDKRNHFFKHSFSAVLVLILICSIFLYGCDNTSTTSELKNEEKTADVIAQLIEPNGKSVNAPIYIKYTTKNPIEIITNVVKKEEGFDYSYLQIKGLKDKAVENKINHKLKVAYDKIAVDKIPPYRGIKSEYPKPGRIFQEYISMQEVGNFNNILSVTINKNTNRTLLDENSKKNPSDMEKDRDFEQSWYTGQTDTLNIDLTTGNEITLADVFCNREDYMNLINSYVSKKLQSNNASEEGYYTIDNVKLVEAFKGFQPNCKFALYDFGINFILDYDTPQFDTGLDSTNLFIEYSRFNNKIGITKRFYDEKNSIYESTRPLVKQLQIKNYDTDLNRQDSYEKGKVQIFISAQNSSQYPKLIQKEIKKLSHVDENKIQSMNEKLKKIESRGNYDDISASYELMITAEAVGDYITISRNEYPYCFQEDQMSMPNYFYKTYDLKNMKEVKLKDIFVSGFDYMAAIKKGIDKNQGILYKNITSVGLSSGGIYLSTEEVQDGKTVSSQCYIPYEDIGCENLTIF